MPNAPLTSPSPRCPTMDLIRRCRATHWLFFAFAYLLVRLGLSSAGQPSAAEPAAKVDAALLRGLVADVRLDGAVDDETFLRRVSLDLTGKLPEPDAIRRFLAETAADKRAKVVDD